MDQKTDKRVIKTKHAIYKAFVELLNEKISIKSQLQTLRKEPILTVKHFIITIQISMMSWKK